MFTLLLRRNDKKVHRMFEILLGATTWSFLLSPVWLGFKFPSAIVYLLTFLSIYWSYMCFRHVYGVIRGYRKYRKEMKSNWLEECHKLDYAKLPDKKTLPHSLSDVRHFLLIPAVNESEAVLRDSIESVFNQTFPLNQITLVYTIEEKYAATTSEIIKKIIGDRISQLNKLLIYAHPKGILGEAVGAGAANRTWGARHAVEDLKNSGENVRNYIFSTIDADHVLDPQYLARLSHLFLTSDRRDNKYYTTAVHLFNNNLWRVPTVMRIEANAVTLGTLSDWIVAKPTTKDSFSAYSASLQTLIDADYWDVGLGVDDTIFYWRAFLARNGDFEGVPHFIPYSADAVEGTTYMRSYVSLYKQLLRWGWGAIDFPLSMTAFLINGDIKLSKKLAWTLKHLEKRVVLINMVFLITFGFALLTMVNPAIKQTNFAYSLPNIMSMVLTATLVFLIPGTIVRHHLVLPFPKAWPIWRKLLAYMEGPLIILNLLTFSFFPFLEAQTRMLLGKKMKDLYHTPKLR